MASFYTTFEAARLLGVSLPTVVNWVKGRRLKAHRTPGGHRRIAREDLAAFMLRNGMPVPGELSGAIPSRRKALVVAVPGPVREGTVRQLAAAGYAVEQTSPGFAAGAAAARFVPDVVVVHPDAPDGGDTIRAMRSDRDLQDVRLLAIAPETWHEALAAAGCGAALAFPAGADALVEAVERAFGTGTPRAGGEPAPRRAKRKVRARR